MKISGRPEGVGSKAPCPEASLWRTKPTPAGDAKEDDSCLGAICSGRASCLVNWLCCVLVMPLRACGVYVMPCLHICFDRCVAALCGCCLRGCCIYTDTSFEGDAALGALKKPCADGVKWCRVAELDTARQKRNRASSVEVVEEVQPPRGTAAGGTFEHFVSARGISCLA